MINLKFSVEQVNALLAALGQLPFNQSNNLIQGIVQQAQPQAEELDVKRKEFEASLDDQTL